MMADLTPVDVVKVIYPNKIIVRYTHHDLDEQLADLENRLTKSLQADGKKIQDGPELHVNMQIAFISDEFGGRARRGLINELPYEKYGLSYGVYLYDYGISRIAELDNLRPLDYAFQTEKAPMALIVSLAGIAPSEIIGAGVAVPAEDWSDESITFVGNFVSKGKICLRKDILLDDVSLCGSLFQGGKPLSTLLLEAKLAVPDQADFIKLTSAVDVDKITFDEDKEKDEPAKASTVYVCIDESTNPPKFRSCGRGRRNMTATAAASSDEPKFTGQPQPLPRGNGMGRGKVISDKMHSDQSQTRFQSPSSSYNSNGNSIFGRNFKSEQNKPKGIAGTPGFRVPLSGIKPRAELTFPKIPGYSIPVEESPSAAENNQMVENAASSTSTRSKGRLSPTALVRGDQLLEPYQGMENFPLHELIEKAWDRDLGLKRLNSLQKCSWPHVLNGRNCFIIGGQTGSKGKSLSYLAPIAAQAISDYEKDQKKVRGKGPIGLFICSTKASGQKLKGHLEKFFARCTKIISHFSVGEETRDLVRDVKTNPEFFVTTPEFFLKLNKDYYEEFGFERLRYLVYDDADLLMEHKRDALTRVMQKVAHYLEKIETRSCNLQVIFCGKKWSQAMEIAYQTVLPNPVLIIGAGLQALVYGQVDIRVQFFPTCQEKLEKLLDIVGKHTGNLVIVCRNLETVLELEPVLTKEFGIRPLCMTLEDPPYEEIDRHRALWLNAKAEDKVRMICSEKHLRNLELKDVKTIIHYEMSGIRLDDFGGRHMGMWNLFPDADTDTGNEKLELISHVFLTPDDVGLYNIARQLKRINVKIPQDLDTLAENEEIEKINRSKLCDKFMRFGSCQPLDKIVCTKRHYFKKEELFEESTVPKAGRIEVRVLECETPNTFTAQLQHYYEMRNGKKHNVISYLNMLKRCEDDLNSFYAEESNIVPLSNPEVGTWCALYLDTDEDETVKGYVRGKISAILGDPNSDQPVEFRVFFVDRGDHTCRKLNDLYELPEKFISQPMTVNLILADLKPRSGLSEFTTKDTSKVASVTKDKIFTARIALSVGNTVWVKPMVDLKKNKSGEWIQAANVRMDAIGKSLVEDNPGHLKTLYALCEEVGFDCKIYKTPESLGQGFDDKFHMLGDCISWAHLQIYSLDRPKATFAWFTYVESPDLIYVTQSDFVDLTDSLVEEMQKEIVCLIEGEYGDYSSRFANYYEEGMCVAALTRDDQTWNRGVITKVHDKDENGEKLFDVFFADHGDSQHGMSTFELFPISKKFVSQLPFQAIAVKLSHVRPVKKESDSEVNANSREWDADVALALSKYLLTPDGQSLEVGVMATEKLRKSKRDYPPCFHYEAYILNDSLEVGEYLVENNLAEFVDRQQAYVELIKKKILGNMSAAVEKCLITSEDNDVGEDGIDINEFDIYYGDGGPQSFLNTIIPTEFQRNGITRAPVLDAPSSGSQVATPSPSTSAASPSTSSKTVENLGSSTTPSANAKPSREEKETLPLQTHTSPNTNEPAVFEKKPTVIWTQTKETVTLKIQIPDMKKYTLKIGDDKKTMTFSSEDPSNYCFELMLRGKVHIPPEENLLGQYLLVKMNKVSHVRWPDMTKDKEKRWWLKRDLDNMDEDSDGVDMDEFPSWQRGSNMNTKENEEPTTKRAYETLPVDFEGDDDLSDSDDSYDSNEENYEDLITS